MRFFYGWIVVPVGFVTLLVSLGVRFTFSIFFVALNREFGWDRATTSSLFSASLLLFALAGDLFEGPEFGTINGYLISPFGIGGAFGPWLGGFLFDVTGHYMEAFG
jgi:hypothetical protein